MGEVELRTSVDYKCIFLKSLAIFCSVSRLLDLIWHLSSEVSNPQTNMEKHERERERERVDSNSSVSGL
jgi:hypothetical protein